jgi:FkbM family methyltransferase
MIKRAAINFFNLMGFDIYQKPGKHYKNKLKLLELHQINCVLDVGANIGQYSMKLRKYGYAGKIISFEPQSKTFQILQENSKKYKNWTVYHCALGAENKTAEINISENTESSSLMEIKDIHVSAAPTAKYVGKETITIKRLDSIYDELQLQNHNVFLKIDTQGFEMEVLKGAENVLNKIVGLQLELSITELYNNETLYDEIIAYLKQKGFGLYQMEHGITDVKTGRLLQFDGIFFKQNNNN